MMFQPNRATRSRPRIDMLPMIDVAIFLLVFFMLFTTFKTNEAGLEVNLPRAATGSEQVPSQLTVTITRSGAVYLEDSLVTLETLRSQAERVAAVNPNATVTIRGDSQAYWEHAVAVMDAARQAGLARFAFSTQPLTP